MKPKSDNRPQGAGNRRRLDLGRGLVFLKSKNKKAVGQAQRVSSRVVMWSTACLLSIMSMRARLHYDPCPNDFRH